MPIATPQGTLDFKSVDTITFVGASSNTVIDTTTGSLGVGVDVNGPTSNLHVVGNAFVSSNLTVSGKFIGDGSALTGISSNLQVITDFGNVTSNTVQFTNAITSLTATSNIEVGGNLTASGNVAIGSSDLTKKLTVGGPMRITDGLSNVCDINVVVAAGSVSSTQIQKLVSGRTGNIRFGKSAQITKNGNFFVSCATYDNGNYGTLHVFSKSGSTWSHRHSGSVLYSPTMNMTGCSISNDGEYVAGGTSYGAGAAYVWKWNGSSYGSRADLSNYGGYSSCQSMAMNAAGSKLIVGDASFNGDSGRIQIFTRSGTNTWSVQQTISTPVIASYGRFGQVGIRLCTDESAFTVGHMGLSNDDRAYLYRLSGSSYVLEQTFSPSGTTEMDFGRDCAMNSDGTKIIVGAPSYDSPGQDSGAAYISTKSGGSWSALTMIQPTDAGAWSATTGFFGSCVAMSDDGNKVLVGGAGSTGALYLYQLIGSTWTQKVKWQPTDIAANDSVGIASTEDQPLSIASDDTFVIGVRMENSGNGSCYVGSITSSAGSTNLICSLPIKANGTILSFTGQHICVPSEPMTQGLVVSANKNKYFNLNGALTTGVGAIRSSESIPMVSLSNVANDRSVFGVVDGIESGISTIRKNTIGPIMVTSEKEMGDNRVIVNSIGEGAIQVVNTNGPLVSGDYMTTSNITGYAQKQDSEFLANYTVAKITMDCDFNPADVPIQVIKKKDNGENDLDKNGFIQWEDHPTYTQKAYNIGYLAADGTHIITATDGTYDEANVVHTTAYVGCTYHCG